MRRKKWFKHNYTGKISGVNNLFGPPVHLVFSSNTNPWYTTNTPTHNSYHMYSHTQFYFTTTVHIKKVAGVLKPFYYKELHKVHVAMCGKTISDGAVKWQTFGLGLTTFKNNGGNVCDTCYKYFYKEHKEKLLAIRRARAKAAHAKRNEKKKQERLEALKGPQETPWYDI